MTARELIQHLSTLDPETRIFIGGYEEGYEDAIFTGIVTDMHLNVYDEWGYGPHQLAHEDSEEDYETVKGIIL